jgi:hypothetical protein
MCNLWRIAIAASSLVSAALYPPRACHKPGTKTPPTHQLSAFSPPAPAGG